MTTARAKPYGWNDKSMTNVQVRPRKFKAIKPHRHARWQRLAAWLRASGQDPYTPFQKRVSKPGAVKAWGAENDVT